MSEIEFFENSIDYASDREGNNQVTASRPQLLSEAALTSPRNSLDEVALPQSSNLTYQTNCDTFDYFPAKTDIFGDKQEQDSCVLVKVWPQYHQVWQPDLELSPSTEACQDGPPTRLSSDDTGEAPSLEQWIEVKEC